MIRFAHMADLHLGFRQYSRLKHGINIRETDVAKAFRAAVDQAIEKKLDFTIIAGDLFHQVSPTNTVIRFCFKQIQRLAVEMPVYIIAGNHDTPRSSEVGCILYLLREIENVTVAVDKTIEVTHDTTRICLWPHAAMDVAPKSLDSPVVAHQILVCHGEVPGAYGTGMESGGSAIEDGEVAGGWDYVALGHYHVRTECAPGVWYSGSLEYVSSDIWSESRAGKPKGWNLVEMDDDDTLVTPVFTPTREVVDLEPIDCSGFTPEQIDTAVALAAVECQVKDKVVRQTLTHIHKSTYRDVKYSHIRKLQSLALHYQLTARIEANVNAAPMIHKPGAPLKDVVTEYLRKQATVEVETSALVALFEKVWDEIGTEEVGGEGFQS